MSAPKLAETSGIPYATLRKIFELRSVVDYEQLRKIAKALDKPTSEIAMDAESLIAKGEVKEEE